jgi:hypothetical protein
MAPVTRDYLDSNISTYLFEGNDRRAAELRSMLPMEQRTDRQLFTTSELNLAETPVGAYRKSDEQLIVLDDNRAISNHDIEVCPVDGSILWRSAILRFNYRTLKLPGAIHRATAFASNCSHFPSGDDRHFLDHGPGRGNNAKTIQIVRPEQSVLEEIRAST